MRVNKTRHYVRLLLQFCKYIYIYLYLNKIYIFYIRYSLRTNSEYHSDS
ncbi:unnamed protein product [Nezara viridula]|uniref:Uncharacterized protein n=1 Tax=Nezara viridula TaxID=85310 RepID=A0A9P0MQM8_NEZVI|nr:unnamed protein product [Nezara viridula]